MTKRYPDPSPPQGELDLGTPVTLNGLALKFDCPYPQRLGQDQYRCTLCALVWDIDESKPPCQRTDIHPENRE